MANDKLRDLTPVDVLYAPGERPTDEKLEGGETQTKLALEYLENTVGDAFGESLSTNLAWISNLSRDIGDRSALNPVLMPSISLTSYVQSLTLGETDHELDLIPVGTGSSIISFSSDTSIVIGQFKSTVAELEEPGDWTILSGLTEGGVSKNSRRLITHAPSSGGSVTFAEMTSGRGSAYEGARNNTIPSIAQAESGGPFLSVSVSDAVNNIYTITLPTEDVTKDRQYDNTTASLSNTEAAVGTGQQLKLPSWMFDAAGLDMGSDASGGGPKTFPLNSIRIYDWTEQKVVDGLLEVEASSTVGNREFEITCTFRSDVILDDVSGQYILVTNGTSISEMLGALAREMFFHTHDGDDMVRGIDHSKMLGLRTGSVTTSARSEYYGPSSIHNNDHSMYLHRDGYTASDVGAGGNVFRGDLVVGNQNTGSEPDHENFNLLDDSYAVTFAQLNNGGRIYFDKVRNHNIPEGRGNVPALFSDTALVIEGSLDDGSSTIKTVYVDQNLRVGRDVVLGTDQTHDVFITGDVYIKNSQILIPRTTSGLTPETGMVIYDSSENSIVYYNGTDWVNGSSIGFAATVGDGIISFGKYNGTGAATIQAAINDAEAQGGGKVKVLRGNYSYGSSVVEIGSNVFVEGEGEATNIASTGTAFRFEVGSDASGMDAMKIDAATACIELNGTGHTLGGGLALSSATGTKVLNLTTDVETRVARMKPANYADSLYMIDPIDKASVLDKWKRLSGSGVVAYVDDTDSKIGRGRFTITGTGLFAFEDYMPVMPDAGIGGYINIKTDGVSDVTIGFQAYDADLSLLPSNGGFLENGFNVPASYEYLQDICVLEAASGFNRFPVGTRFIRATIEVTSNTGTISFDGFNIFPMNFSTISLYS